MLRELLHDPPFEDHDADEVFVDLTEPPLDDYDGSLDGDDRLVAPGSAPEHVVESEVLRRAPVPPDRKKYRVVPFRRVLKRGMRGRDVLALQRALRARGIRKRRPTGFYGAGTKDEVRRYQRLFPPGDHNVGLPGLEPDGVYGARTHQRLKRWYDDYGVWLIINTRLETKEDRWRNQIIGHAILSYNRRSEISYTQSSRRMQGVRERIRPPRVPRWEDCSSWVTWLYWLVGAPDPNGLGYNGYGFTGSQIAHGTRRWSGWKKAALHFYGRSAITHVAIDVGGGRVVSHGYEGGPVLVSRNYRRDWQFAHDYF